MPFEDFPEPRRPRWVPALAVALVTLGGVGWAYAGAPGAPEWMMPQGHLHARDAPAERAEVHMHLSRFEPERVLLVPGGNVTWVNHDGEPHRVLVERQDDDAQSPELVPLDAWSHEFHAPGEYAVRCPLHATQTSDGTWQGMVGVVRVVAA